MKWILTLAVITTVIFSIYSFRNYVSPQRKTEMIASTPKSFFELSYLDIHGKTVSMSAYKGKYVLCVNVASKCGNTPQYKALQSLSDKYKDKLVIIGFPCNQFLGQEPGSEAEIESFCQKNYGVTFPLSSKLDVKGKDQHPVYTWLTTKELNGVSDDKIDWNFHKVLVSPDGKWLKSFAASTSPESPEILSMIK